VIAVRRTRLLAGLALVLFVLDIVLVMAASIAAYIVEADDAYDPYQAIDTIAVNIVLGVAFALVGGVIAVKRPGNAIGWACFSRR
jgi:hypothetical protein